MRIVHYTLGLYPKRVGGLNRYATDLLKEQSWKHDVSIIVPGRWNMWSKRCSISVAKTDDGVSCYHLNNALPLPLLYGIRKPRCFFEKKISRKSFEQFWTNVRPEVLHLHTLMGMPEDALRFFKEKGVKVVYTSHDYFGICPKVNLINENGNLCEGPHVKRCAVCNAKAPSIMFLRWRNSRLIFVLRDTVRWLKNTINC